MTVTTVLAVGLLLELGLLLAVHRSPRLRAALRRILERPLVSRAAPGERYHDGISESEQ